MLFEFLTQYKKEVIQLCRDKVLAAGESKPTSELLDRGLPVFYDELIGVLHHTVAHPEMVKNAFSVEGMIKEGDAAAHGKESLRLGYTISQVVHAYGAVCQAITEFVQTKSFKIAPQEFHDLNLSLDYAIAEAVTEYEKTQSENVSRKEVERLGFLIHELGNSLMTATAAHSMILKGHVGSAGITSKLLTGAHERMRKLIDSSLAEVRAKGHAEVMPAAMNLKILIDEVVATAKIMGKSKEVHLKMDVNPGIEFTADRQMIFSALSNLVNNAVKFSKKHSHVTVRGEESEGRILIEVEDQCGGLPEGKAEDLFKPFVQRGSDKSGMGLGLSLSKRVVELNQGKLTVRDIPGKGCVFSIDLPAKKVILQSAA